MYSICLVLLTLLLTSAVGSPVYPLYAIDSFFMPLTDDDYKVMANDFTHVQGSYTADELEHFKQTNPHFSPVWYIQTGKVKANVLENAGRLNAAFYLTGTLGEDLDSTTTTFTYQSVPKVATLKSSNTTGNVSSHKGYVTFIRIENEILKLVDVKQTKSNESQLTVMRGFDKTEAAKHSKGANVFAPAYSGYSYPGGPQALTYILDATQQLAVDVLVNHTVTGVRMGYAGSWFDCFSSRPFQPVDMAGTSAKTWNFAKNEIFNQSDYIVVQRERLKEVFEQSIKILGHKLVILANNAFCYFTGNCKLLLEKSPGFFPLDGYSIEGFSGHEDTTDPVNGCDATKLSLRYPAIDEWTRNVEILMNAAQNNLAAFPMIAQAGCKSVYLEIVGGEKPEIRDKFENFGYGSYLMGIENPDGPTRFGIPAFYRNGTRRYAYVHPRYSLDIGTPQKSAQNVSEYQVAGHSSYLRPFSGGIVVVNPSNQTDSQLDLGGSFYDPVSKKKTSTLVPEAQTGHILVKDV